MTGRERADAEDLLRILRREIIEQDSRITEFQIRSESATEIARTARVRIHLIPRRLTDWKLAITTGGD